MKDEIKKIIESSRKIIKSNRENGFDRIIMLGDDIDELLDYITNLQEENIELKRKIKFNEKSRRKMQQTLMQQIEDYKSRNEKAIEFVKKESRKCYTNQTSENPLKVIGNFMWHTDELLNILQGEDKDENN